MHQVALGEAQGEASLVFPEDETWLGSLSDTIDHGMQAVRVPVARLDDYLADAAGRVLVKIDVEGLELPVLRGGLELIRRHHREIIFESRRGDPNRQAIHALLTAEGYRVICLSSEYEITIIEFVDSGETNFLARAIGDLVP